MNKLKKLLEKISQKSNILIAILGVILLISVILVYCFPHTNIVILIACIACGIMNILQGLKYIHDIKKRTTGWSVIMLGIIIIVVGFAIFGK